jgi:long-chain fatty acid transport protein
MEAGLSMRRARNMKNNALVITVAGLSALLLSSEVSMATEGYFSVGSGARQKALAGAGVADSKDATAISLNPAGLVDAGNQFSASVSVFSPNRKAERFQEVKSDRDIFFIPNMAYSRQLNADTAFGLSLYANGGMNTSYGPDKANAAFNFGPAGTQLYSDLLQAFVSAGIARRYGSVSVGIAPIFAMQQFEARGLQNYDNPGGRNPDWTSAKGYVTNRGEDMSYGGGVRGGIQWQAMPGLRFGLAASSRIYMTEFDKYKGLFAEQGDFDIPATLQAGVAIDATPDFTMMLDYKRIWYSAVDAIANDGPVQGLNAPPAGRQLGEDNGIGFGWDDINIYKVGMEWDYSPDLTLRAGYSYNDNPLQKEHMTFNVIAPAVVQHHITAGARLKANDRMDLEFAGAYVPEADMTGPDNGPPQPTANTMTFEMSQWEATMGIVWKLN